MAGVTTSTDDVAPPGNHVYDCAPLAVSVTVVPLHITGLEEMAESVGVGLTLWVTATVLVHPLTLLPLTVY